MNTIDPSDPRVRRAVATVLAVADSMAWEDGRDITPGMLARAESRGYFLPEEDDRIRIRYQSFLGGRAALLAALASMEEACGRDESKWPGRIPAFAVGLAAACVLNHGSRELLGLVAQSRLLRKKLDEADPRRGIPRKTFARLYRAAADLRRQAHFLESLAFFRSHGMEVEALRGSDLGDDLLALLKDYAEEFNDRDGVAVFREHLRYRWFSFRRRHHSGWKKAVFGVFEGSGRWIADLRQPGMKPGGSGKRVTAELREQAIRLARPGDIFITRHDDALSNLFLPGFWPHAVLYVGSEADRAELGLALDPAQARQAADPVRFLEAKKDGVRFRPAEETLAVDRFLILRPPLSPEEISEAITRSAAHAGKLYDFAFDFRRSDRLACTEVIYRAYDGCGPITFSLLETGGRLCLPAEELITQALAKNFEVVAAFGVGDSGLLTGPLAKAALDASRTGL